MNRRTFVERLAIGIAGFTILPGAGRVWRAERYVYRCWVHLESNAAMNIVYRLMDDGVRHVFSIGFNEIPPWPGYKMDDVATVTAIGKQSYFKRLFEDLVPS